MLQVADWRKRWLFFYHFVPLIWSDPFRSILCNCPTYTYTVLSFKIAYIYPVYFFIYLSFLSLEYSEVTTGQGPTRSEVSIRKAVSTMLNIKISKKSQSNKQTYFLFYHTWYCWINVLTKIIFTTFACIQNLHEKRRHGYAHPDTEGTFNIQVVRIIVIANKATTTQIWLMSLFTFEHMHTYLIDVPYLLCLIVTSYRISQTNLTFNSLV